MHINDVCTLQKVTEGVCWPFIILNCVEMYTMTLVLGFYIKKSKSSHSVNPICSQE